MDRPQCLGRGGRAHGSGDAIARQAAALDYTLLTARRREKDFLLRRDDKYFALHAEAITAANAALDGISRALPPGDNRHDQVKTVRDGVAAYVGTFRKVGEMEVLIGLTVNDGLRGALRKSVKAIEDELKVWPNMDALWNKMLGMRQAEKDFMLYGQDEYLGLHRKYSIEFDLKMEFVGASGVDRRIIFANCWRLIPPTWRRLPTRPSSPLPQPRP